MDAISDPCTDCGFEMVEVSHKNLERARKLIGVPLRTISDEQLRTRQEWYPICPRCDAYALGVDLTEGVPFRCRDGQVRTVHDLDLWGSDDQP